MITCLQIEPLTSNINIIISQTGSIGYDDLNILNPESLPNQFVGLCYDSLTSFTQQHHYQHRNNNEDDKNRHTNTDTDGYTITIIRSSNTFLYWLYCQVDRSKTSSDMLSNILFIALWSLVHFIFISTWTTDSLVYNSWHRGLLVDTRHLDQGILGSNPASLTLSPWRRLITCISSPHSSLNE